MVLQEKFVSNQILDRRGDSPSEEGDFSLTDISIWIIFSLILFWHILPEICPVTQITKFPFYSSQKNEPKNPKQMKAYHFWTNSPSVPKWTTTCKSFIITVYVAGLQILVHSYGTSFLIKHSEVELDKYAQILMFPRGEKQQKLWNSTWEEILKTCYFKTIQMLLLTF